MSDQTKITAPVRSEKVKDPGRLDQGKRLPEISKQAKEHKMRKKIESEREESTSWSLDYRDVIAIIGVIVAMASFGHSIRKSELQPEP